MSTIGSVLQTGMNGIARGVRGANEAANDIAKVGTRPAKDNATTDIAEAAVNLKQSELQVKASAKVVKAADEMMGTILDIKV